MKDSAYRVLNGTFTVVTSTMLIAGLAVLGTSEILLHYSDNSDALTSAFFGVTFGIIWLTGFFLILQMPRARSQTLDDEDLIGEPFKACHTHTAQTRREA
jgi:hypothetical protein